MNKYQTAVIEALKDSTIEHWITHIEQYKTNPDIFDDFSKEILMDFADINSTKSGEEFIDSISNKEFENSMDSQEICCLDDCRSIVYRADDVLKKYKQLTKNLTAKHKR